MCRSKKSKGRVQPERPVRVVQEEEDLICPLYVLQARNRVPPLQVAMEIDSHQLLMEVDTGAAYSLISDTTFKEFWPDRRLEKSDVRLCTYSGEPIEVLGSLTVTVKYLNQESEEPLLVVKGTGPTLLGRNWMEHIRLDWPQINLVQLGSLQATRPESWWSLHLALVRLALFHMPTGNWLRKNLTAWSLREFWNLLSFLSGHPLSYRC